MNPSQSAALQLRDIHLPPPAEWWPPAPGWWLLGVALLALLCWGGVAAARRLKLHRQRRHILDLLEQIEDSAADTPAFLAQLSSLLKRIALLRYPRTSIAALAGRDWLRFLDATGGDGRFCNGPGQVLATGAYVRELPGSVDNRALTALVREWVMKNTAAGKHSSTPSTAQRARGEA